MAQLRGRSQRTRVKAVGKPTNYPTHRMDPIFDEILQGDWEEMPGVFGALETIEAMRDWGVEVTPEIARKCLMSHVGKAHSQAKYRARAEQRIMARRHPPIVYYMKLGPLVKIGYTTNLTSRMDAIHPEEVMVTEPGGRERELVRHQQFADLREHGEWFRLEAPLTDHIEAVRREAAGD